MVITRISDFGIKITQGTLSLAINPAGDKENIIGGTFGADIVLLSAPHTQFDSAEHFTKKDDETFVIQGPGEYEREELFIYGVGTTTSFGGNSQPNTVYYFNLDSIDVLVMGANEPDTLPSDLTELVDNVDLLIMPIAGDEILGAVSANKLATKLEASLVLPVGFNKKDDPQLGAFQDEFSHKINMTDKLTLRSTDIPETPEAHVIL